MKSYILLFFVMVLLITVSCQKEEILFDEAILEVEVIVAQPIDTAKYQIQLSLIKDLTKEIVFDSLQAKSSLKNGSIPDLTHIIINPISREDYYVNNYEAVKIYDYMVLSLNSFINDEFAIYQIFPINNGVIDSTNYRIEYEVGPPSSSRSFYLKSSNYLVRTAYHFHGNNGSQIDFYGESNNSHFVLPNYPNGFWQLVFEFNINGRQEFYESKPIDYHADSNELTLNLQLSQGNTVSVIELNKSLIVGAKTLEVQGYDINGIYRYMTIPVVYNKNMPNIISYSLPIDVSFVYICGEDYCSYYEAKCVAIKTGNISVFNLTKIW